MKLLLAAVVGMYHLQKLRGTLNKFKGEKYTAIECNRIWQFCFFFFLTDSPTSSPRAKNVEFRH